MILIYFIFKKNLSSSSVHQFILWNRREIILDGPTTSQNQLMSPLSQTAMPMDNEAPLPTSSPLVSKFK
jgi:hypothetical protein